MISAVFAVTIFLYITVILNEEFLWKIFAMNQTGPGMEKCCLDDLLSELGFPSEQFSLPSSRIWEKCARNTRSETELICFFRGKIHISAQLTGPPSCLMKSAEFNRRLQVRG